VPRVRDDGVEEDMKPHPISAFRWRLNKLVERHQREHGCQDGKCAVERYLIEAWVALYAAEGAARGVPQRSAVDQMQDRLDFWRT